jgi:hypothetical protein
VSTPPTRYPFPLQHSQPNQHTHPIQPLKILPEVPLHERERERKKEPKRERREQERREETERDTPRERSSSTFCHSCTSLPPQHLPLLSHGKESDRRREEPLSPRCHSPAPPPPFLPTRVPTRPYGRTKKVHICGFQRSHVVWCLALVSGVMLWRTRALWTLLWAGGVFAGGTLAHAGLRSPNLKARLSSYREEFRAVWRGYSEA